MQVFDTYPPYAVGGSCFITKEYDVSGGKKVISLDVDVDSLPAHGMLCISEEAVRQLNVALGWDANEEGAAQRKALEARVKELEADLAKYRSLMAVVSEFDHTQSPKSAIAASILAEDEDQPEVALGGPNVEEMTKAELLEVATRLDITGRHAMSKSELLDSILDAS